MSVDDRLRRGLSSAWDESDREVEGLLQDALRAGRRRRRIYAAVSVVALLAVMAGAIAAPRMLAQSSDEPGLHPIGPTDESEDEAPYGVIAGTWVVVIPERNRAAKRHGFDGRWVMKLSADGIGRVVSHPPLESSFVAINSFTFTLSGGRFTSGAFSDEGHCLSREQKTYRWRLEAGELSFVPENDNCAFRRMLLATKAWHRK